MLKVSTTNKRGRLKESADIISNDPYHPITEISLSATVKQFISVEPSMLIKLKGFPGEEVAKKVTIISHEEQPLKITNITSTIDDRISYQLKPLQEGKSYSLEIKTSPCLKESFKGKIVLKTSSLRKPEVGIVVSGSMKNVVKVAPAYLYFGIINSSMKAINPQSLKRTAMIERLSGDDLTIRKVETNKDWITTETETIEKGKKHTIVITLDKDKLPKGEFREKVAVHTEYSKKSEVVTIIIEGKVK